MSIFHLGYIYLSFIGPSFEYFYQENQFLTLISYFVALIIKLIHLFQIFLY